ncbi:MAG TPA: hypothetical protein PLI68_06670 [Bacteroidia bacterium]|nr:hypothetical protein [Bacteroidia bacterium]HRH07338.1 hypothetical protein [Bacteroidia bacterium]HRH62991.1 hypothetical protein [Bacteroidia bacterium]
MKRIERILFIILLLSILLKLLFIPGSSILIVLVASILSLFYFIFTFALINELSLRQLFFSNSYSRIGSLKVVGIIGLGIGLSLATTGLMFIMQNWSGGLANLFGGIIIIFVIGIVALIKRQESENKIFYDKVLLRVGVSILVGLIAFLISGISV